MTPESSVDALHRLCREHTDLRETDIECLERFARVLPCLSDLDDSDVFIDCLHRDGDFGVVVAEGHPPGGRSLYDLPVTGQLVMRENEPAVFRAFASGGPVREIMAVTQENRAVSQAVAPIRNDDGRIVGVLIQERDVSDSVNRDKRYRSLAQLAQERKDLLSRMGADSAGAPIMDDASLAVKEIHHRVKNNLQLIASMLSLQARKTRFPEVKNVLRENIGKILGIASIYDVLALEETGTGENRRRIFLRSILQNVCYTVAECLKNESEGISARVEGDDMLVDGDKAVTIALAVNELVTNALKHAFVGRQVGTVVVSVMGGNAYSRITVSDDGIGMPVKASERNSLGINIVRSLVAKLGGKLRVESGENGSRATFDFEH